jgi:hypothetical protein
MRKRRGGGREGADREEIPNSWFEKTKRRNDGTPDREFGKLVSRSVSVVRIGSMYVLRDGR